MDSSAKYLSACNDNSLDQAVQELSPIVVNGVSSGEFTSLKMSDAFSITLKTF